MAPNTHHSHFSTHHFVHTYTSYTNILHIEWLLYYRRCLFSVLDLRARYNWWVTTPNTHHSFFLIWHLCILPRITWKLQVVYRHSTYWTTSLLLKTFLEQFRVAWEIQLESYGPRHTCDHSLIQHCLACTASPYILYITIWCTTIYDNKTHVAYDCTTYQTTALLPTMHRFIRTKLASYTTHCSVFSINHVC